MVVIKKSERNCNIMKNKNYPEQNLQAQEQYISKQELALIILELVLAIPIVISLIVVFGFLA